MMRDKRTTENVIVHKRDKTSESNNMTDDDLDFVDDSRDDLRDETSEQQEM